MMVMQPKRLVIWSMNSFQEVWMAVQTCKALFVSRTGLILGIGTSYIQFSLSCSWNGFHKVFEAF